HELRPLLVVRPMLVDSAQRDADVDVPLERHAPALADARDALLLLPLAATARQQALAGFLGDPTNATGLLDLVVDGALDGPGELVTDLLHGPAAAAFLIVPATVTSAAADPSHELPGALRGQRYERRYTYSGGKSLES